MRERRFQSKVIDALEAADEPLTSFEIAQAIRPNKLIPHGRIYRTLSRLASDGVIEKIALPEGFINNAGNTVQYIGYQLIKSEKE